jgi:Holliday junction resolvase RusA-like endonuclease
MSARVIGLDLSMTATGIAQVDGTTYIDATMLVVPDPNYVPPLITIRVLGTPGPQGSKRHVGGGRMVESSKKVAPWRDAVRADAVEAAHECGLATLDQPLVVDMVFTTVRPASHYRAGRNAHLLRDTAPARPSGMPDLSKLARSTEDALTMAGIWRDDARVVEYGRLAKVYAGEDVDALDCPGAVIRIYALGPVT